MTGTPMTEVRDQSDEDAKCSRDARLESQHRGVGPKTPRRPSCCESFSKLGGGLVVTKRVSGRVPIADLPRYLS